MTTRLFRAILLLSVFCLPAMGFSQQTNATAKPEDEFAEKKKETKITEVVPTDSLASSELLKRAVSWIKVENPKYKKTGGTTTGNKAECLASFPCKPKELNPQVDYTGKIVMKVLIECKDSKYRYTIYDIRHESKSGRTTAGSIDNVVPECGSQAMHDLAWKRLKSEAMKDAAKVVADLKAGMSSTVEEKNEDAW
jgi:hypothetical protein